MTNSKWLALVAACGLALTMAACGDDEEGACPDDAQCLAATDACPARCDLGEPTACTSDEDCADDEVCEAGCGCIVACTPDDGTGGTGGNVGKSCEGQADCYSDSYCGDPSGVCEALEDTISGCGLQPTTVSGTGPMLIQIVQLDATPNDDTTVCAKEAACANNGNVCWFRVTAFDPEPQWPGAAALYGSVKFVSSGGTSGPTYQTANGNVDATDSRFFDFDAAGCYSAATTSLGGAFTLADTADQQSNTACVDAANGTAP